MVATTARASPRLLADLERSNASGPHAGMPVNLFIKIFLDLLVKGAEDEIGHPLMIEPASA
jgi:hypothetical protein